MPQLYSIIFYKKNCKKKELKKGGILFLHLPSYSISTIFIFVELFLKVKEAT